MKNGKFEYMRPVSAANNGASFIPLAENTEAMRRWSLGGLIGASLETLGAPTREAQPKGS